MIQIYHEESNHCFEDVLLAYLMRCRETYVYIYADAWKFFFGKKAIDDFGGCEYECIYPHQKAMSELMDMKVKYFSEDVLDNIFIENKFIGVEFDAYYCDWSRAYMKYHLHHYFVAEKYQDGILYGNDPYLQKQEVKIGYDYLISNGGKLFTFDAKTKKITWEDVISQLLEINMDMFENIRCFGRMIKTNNLYEYFQEYKADITGCPLYNNITYILNSRRNISRLIYYLAQVQKDGFLQNIYGELKNISEQWYIVKNIMMKMMFSAMANEKKASEVEQRILLIADNEEKVYKMLANEAQKRKGF